MNTQSSGEIDFSAPLLTMKNDAATGDDIFSFLLSELDISHESDYLGCLMRCLAVLLNFSSAFSLFFNADLFDEVSYYVDLSMFPWIIAKVMSSRLEDTPIIQDGVVIISTIAQSNTFSSQ